MSEAQTLRDLHQAQNDKEERELDEIVAESQADYDRMAEHLGYQEPKKENNDEN